MKVLLYFDWIGTRKQLKDHDDRIQRASKEVGVEYLGIHGSMNLKWNYCWIFDVRSYDHFMQMTSKVPMPPQMPHYITELLIPVPLPNNEQSLRMGVEKQ